MWPGDVQVLQIRGFQLGQVYVDFTWEFMRILYKICYINHMIHQALPSFYWIPFSHRVLHIHFTSSTF